MSTQHTIELFNDDFFRTLFPLDTNRFLINNFADKISHFIYQNITHEKQGNYSFLPQEKVYASKKGFHLRRTVKLDPVAEFFVYDLVYRNRKVFRKPFQNTRYSYGYRFYQGCPVSAMEEYKSFKLAIYDNSKKYKYFAKFDIASFFNSIYHHDLVIWFNKIGQNEDKLFFDKYLKQINSGRSIDCLPQGLIPTKIIGSNFLEFIDNSSRIKCENLIRFMDDFYLFSDNLDSLIEDFMCVQKLLGNKGLFLNESKTQINKTDHLSVFREIDDIKKKLLQRRQMMIGLYEIDLAKLLRSRKVEELTKEEKEYLYTLLKNDLIQEEDAELILTLLRDESDELLEYLSDFLDRFPNLIKDIFFFTNSIKNKDSLKEVISKFLKNNKYATEYQLFWIARIVERDFSTYSDFGDLLMALYRHLQKLFI